MDRPKTLIVAPYFPLPPDSGGRIRVLEGLRYVANFASITFASLYYGLWDLREYSLLKNLCEDIVLARVDYVSQVKSTLLPSATTKATSPQMMQALARLAEENNFDLVHFHHVYLGEYFELFSDIPIILEDHNVESVVYSRAKNFEEAKKMRKYEIQKWREADEIIVVTEQDKKLICNITNVGAHKVTVSPNGVDCQYFKPHKPQDNIRIVFLGYLDYQPNRDAIKFFHETIWPILKPLELEWIIVGSGNPSSLQDLESDPLISICRNPPDVRPFLDSNSIFIVPLRVGGGSRLKILTAFAMGSPVVSTNIGCEGIPAVSGKHLLIANSTDEMHNAIVRLVNDMQLRNRLGTQARLFVEESFLWNDTLASIKQVYSRLLQ